MKKINLLLGVVFLFCFPFISYCQVGIGTTTPNEYAILDLHSDSKGLLLPRVDYNLIPANPSVKGLMYYVVSNGPDGNDAFYYYRSSGWRRIDIPDSVNWETVTNRPTTLNGYGITDAVTKEGFQATASDFVGTTNSMPLVMKSNNSEAMRINPSGKIGIGNTNPNSTAKLTITPQGSEAPLQLEGLQVSNPVQNDFLVVDSAGNISKRPDALGGLTSIVTFATSIQVPQINNNSTYQTTLAVPGAQPGASVMIGPETDLSSGGGTVLIQGWVQTPGVVSIRWINVQNQKANVPLTVYHLTLLR